MKECREAGKKSEEGAGDEEEEGTDEQRSGVEHKGNGNGGNGECPASKTRSGTVDGQGRTTTAPGTSPRAVSTPSPIHDPAARSRRRIARPAPPPFSWPRARMVGEGGRTGVPDLRLHGLGVKSAIVRAV